MICQILIIRQDLKLSLMGYLIYFEILYQLPILCRQVDPLGVFQDLQLITLYEYMVVTVYHMYMHITDTSV